MTSPFRNDTEYHGRDLIDYLWLLKYPTHQCVTMRFLWSPSCRLISMMTSSNGNTFRVTGPLCGEFPTQRPVTRSFDVFFDPRLNKRLSKQSWGWWFETPSGSLWRHCNVHQKHRFDYLANNHLKSICFIWKHLHFPTDIWYGVRRLLYNTQSLNETPAMLQTK